MMKVLRPVISLLAFIGLVSILSTLAILSSGDISEAPKAKASSYIPHKFTFEEVAAPRSRGPFRVHIEHAPMHGRISNNEDQTMGKLLLSAIAALTLACATSAAQAQSWGRGGAYTGASPRQGYYPGRGVHRCTWSISGGCAAWRARGGKPAPGRVPGQRKGVASID
jgi:hypothetical protein